MTGGRQIQSRASTMDKLLGKKVRVEIENQTGYCFTGEGVLERRDDNGFNYGFYVRDMHIPLRSLVRKGMNGTDKLKVDLDYLDKE